MKLRLQVYKRLFKSIQHSGAVGPELISQINSVTIPQALVNVSYVNQNFVSSADHTTDSLADRILLDAVESICFENGIQTISRACLVTLTQIMRITIQNFAGYIHSLSVPLKPKLDKTNETKTALPLSENTTMNPACVVFVAVFVHS